MPDLRGAVLAELQRRIDLCRAAAADDGGGGVRARGEADRNFLAAHDPQTMERVWLAIHHDAQLHGTGRLWLTRCAEVLGLEVPTDAR